MYESVVFVQFVGDRPAVVIGEVREDGRCPRWQWYDVYHCRRDGRLYRWFCRETMRVDLTPFAGEKFWAAPSAFVRGEADAERLADLLPPLDDMLGHLRLTSVPARCRTCDDEFPPDALCPHLFFCADCGTYAGDGAEDAKNCRHPSPVGEMTLFTHLALLGRAKPLLAGSAARWVDVEPRPSLGHPYTRGRKFVVRRDGAALVLFRTKVHRRPGRPFRRRWQWVLYDPSGMYVTECIRDGKKPGPPKAWADERCPDKSEATSR